MYTAAKTTSKLLITLKDPTGRKRAHARQQAIRIGSAASAGALIALVAGLLERRRRRNRAASAKVDPSPQAKPRTAGTTDAGGNFRSRHGAGASTGAGTSTGRIPMSGAATGASSGRTPIPMQGTDPLDKLAASAERLQTWGGDEPGYRAHLGFGIGGSIPAASDSAAGGERFDRGEAAAEGAPEPIGGSMPTGGGDALGGTVRGGDDVGYADEIVTGAGEAISNSTTPSQNGHGSLH